MRIVLIIALKEIREGLRNRWVLATTLLLAILALTLAFLGSAPTGSIGASPLRVVVVSLSSLSVFLVPLIALLLSHDAIIGEAERGAMLLLLSYPLARWQVIAGKFAGHLAILAFATLIGYGAAAGMLTVVGEAVDPASWAAFSALIGSSVILGAGFLAIGYLVSALVRERGTAAGISIGIWLVFVLIYDMALLGLLIVDQGHAITPSILNALLLLNPTDVYRLLNLDGGAVGALSGMGNVANHPSLGPTALIAALIMWTAVPLVAAMLVFSKREL
ncbi:ABC transporter permease [Sphingosinicella microcystinivorans]|uniref:ABC transporter permease n=1 Tax=Sphingosinicella microcystinivorans TaxID=335406 RepID=UPI0022F3CB45|nr:ABC transporter permease [Sphingosinicella microcystinivorans]WBX82843.1 ABC transporter permease [Sphingosinicella microcystinivorans]